VLAPNNLPGGVSPGRELSWNFRSVVAGPRGGGMLDNTGLAGETHQEGNREFTNTKVGGVKRVRAKVVGADHVSV